MKIFVYLHVLHSIYLEMYIFCQVCYDSTNRHGNDIVWAHLDDQQEIAIFGSRSSRKRRNMNQTDQRMILEPARKRQKLSENSNNRNYRMNAPNSNSHDLRRFHEERRSKEYAVKIEKENKSLKTQIIELKELLNAKNNNSNLKLGKEESKKLEFVKLSLNNIDTLNEDELNELETNTYNKITELQNNIKSIKEAKERLLDDKLRCIACLKNQKNIVIQGCNHFDLCDECESKLSQKTCPRCQASYNNIIKLNV